MPLPAKAARAAGVARAARVTPRIFVGALVLIAIGVMLAGVFLRYVMVPITNAMGVDPINFFWVEEVGEMLLAWLTLVGAAVGIAERTHFTVNLFTERLPATAQRAIRVINHVIIALFGGVVAWQGWAVAGLNKGLATPALEVSMGWLYGSLVVGGALIALFALTTINHPEPTPHHVVE